MRWKRQTGNDRHRQHWLPDASGEAGRTSVRHWIEIVEQALEKDNKMKTKVILSQQMASAIIAEVRKRRRKITGLFPLLLPMTRSSAGVKSHG